MIINAQTLQQHVDYAMAGFTTINEPGNISGSFLKNLSWSFDKQGPYRGVLDNEINFSGKQFYFYGDDILLFKYSSFEELNQDKINWEKRLKKKNFITSETVDGKQVLEPSGYFEFDGKFYLLGLLYQDFNSDDNNESEGVYKGIIIDHLRYFKVDETKSSVLQKVIGTL